MNKKKYNQLRIVVLLYISIIAFLALVSNNYLLLIIGLVTGFIFMTLVRLKARINVDERETTIQEKAARMTYAIFTPTIGISALLLLIPSYSGISIFAKGEFVYLESLGIVFAYLALFLIALYAISYYFLNRKYGGGDKE